MTLIGTVARDQSERWDVKLPPVQGAEPKPSTSASEESNGHRLGLPLPQPAGKGSYRPATTANWEVSLLQAMNSLDMLPGHDGTPAHRFQTMRQINTRSTAPSKGGDSASSLAPVPASLQQYVSAPYTISLPGSKVKPGPHNLAALAATATRQHMLWLLQQSKAGAGAGQLPTHHMILASGGAAAWAPKARHMSPVSRGGDGGGTQGAAGHTVKEVKPQSPPSPHLPAQAQPQVSSLVMVGALVAPGTPLASHGSYTGSHGLMGTSGSNVGSAGQQRSGGHGSRGGMGGGLGSPTQERSSNSLYSTQGPSSWTLSGPDPIMLPVPGAAVFRSHSGPDATLWAAHAVSTPHGHAGVSAEASSVYGYSMGTGPHGSHLTSPNISVTTLGAVPSKMSSTALLPSSLSAVTVGANGFTSSGGPVWMTNTGTLLPANNSEASLTGAGGGRRAGGKDTGGAPRRKQQPGRLKGERSSKTSMQGLPAAGGVAGSSSGSAPAMRYPPFVYTFTPLSKPLPMGSSPVLRNGKLHPAAALVAAGGGMNTIQAAGSYAAGLGGLTSGPSSGDVGGVSSPAGVILSTLIPGEPPTIDPGQGLTSHMAALRSQQGSRALTGGEDARQQQLQQADQEAAVRGRKAGSRSAATATASVKQHQKVSQEAPAPAPAVDGNEVPRKGPSLSPERSAPVLGQRFAHLAASAQEAGAREEPLPTIDTLYAQQPTSVPPSAHAGAATATASSPSAFASSGPPSMGGLSAKQGAEQPSGVHGLQLEAGTEWPPVVPRGVANSDITPREGPALPLAVQEREAQVEPEATEQTVDYSVHNSHSVSHLHPDVSHLHQGHDDLLEPQSHHQLLTSGSPTQHGSSEGTTPVPDHVLAAQASATRLRVRELLPSQDAEAVRLQALTRLNGELEGLVEGIRREIEAVNAQDVAHVLKTKHTHHKRGPLPNLHPEVRLSPLHAALKGTTQRTSATHPSVLDTLLPSPAQQQQQQPLQVVIPSTTFGSTLSPAGGLGTATSQQGPPSSNTRTPMFDRRQQLLAPPARTSSTGAPGDSPGLSAAAESPAGVPLVSSGALLGRTTSRLAGSAAGRAGSLGLSSNLGAAIAGTSAQPEQQDPASRLPAYVSVDVQEAEAAASEVAAAVAAAAEAAAQAAAAAAAAQSQPLPARPPTRQGLAEALVTVGAALASAAAQLPPPTPLGRSASGAQRGTALIPPPLTSSSAAALAVPPGLTQGPGPALQAFAVSGGQQLHEPQVLQVVVESSSSSLSSGGPTSPTPQLDSRPQSAAGVEAEAVPARESTAADLDVSQRPAPAEAGLTAQFAAASQVGNQQVAEALTSSGALQPVTSHRLASSTSRASSSGSSGVGTAIDGVLGDIISHLPPRPPFSMWQAQYQDTSVAAVQAEQQAMQGGSSSTAGTPSGGPVAQPSAQVSAAAPGDSASAPETALATAPTSTPPVSLPPHQDGGLSAVPSFAALVTPDTAQPQGGASPAHQEGSPSQSRVRESSFSTLASQQFAAVGAEEPSQQEDASSSQTVGNVDAQGMAVTADQVDGTSTSEPGTGGELLSRSLRGPNLAPFASAPLAFDHISPHVPLVPVGGPMNLMHDPLMDAEDQEEVLLNETLRHMEAAAAAAAAAEAAAAITAGNSSGVPSPSTIGTAGSPGTASISPPILIPSASVTKHSFSAPVVRTASLAMALAEELSALALAGSNSGSPAGQAVQHRGPAAVHQGPGSPWTLGSLERGPEHQHHHSSHHQQPALPMAMLPQGSYQAHVFSEADLPAPNLPGFQYKPRKGSVGGGTGTSLSGERSSEEYMERSSYGHATSYGRAATDVDAAADEHPEREQADREYEYEDEEGLDGSDALSGAYRARGTSSAGGARPYYSDDEGGTMGEGGMASDDGEVLSVSAYGIGPAQKLSSSFGRRSTTAGRGPPNVNDVVDEDGVRVLGQKYEVHHMVGEGAYGKVMKCRVRGSDPETWVAVKEFKIEDDDPDAEDVKRTSRREVLLLRTLQHKNVVGFLDEFLVRDRLFIVMEFVPCNLLELLEAQPGGMDREAVRLIMYQLCTAISFIHSKGVVYRDIKPENLLVDEHGRLKLCDFGFARFVTGTPEEKLTDYVATRWYRAPELLLGPPFDEEGQVVQSRYGPPIDMWAIGCLMGELMDGEPLFAGDSDLDQLYRIQTLLGPVTPDQGRLFDRNPHNAGIIFNLKEPMTLAKRYESRMTEVELDFMAHLLSMDPGQRMTGEECLQHPYLLDLTLSDQVRGGDGASTPGLLSSRSYLTTASTPNQGMTPREDNTMTPATPPTLHGSEGGDSSSLVTASEGQGLVSRTSHMSDISEAGGPAVRSSQPQQQPELTARVSQMSGTLMLGSVVASEVAEGEQVPSLPQTPVGA